MINKTLSNFINHLGGTIGAGTCFVEMSK